MSDFLFGGIILAIVLSLGLVELAIRKKRYASVNLTDEELRKLGAFGFRSYADRVFDILFFVLLAFFLIFVVGRFVSSACPLNTLWAKMFFYASVTIIPVGIGYAWNLTPPGGKWLVDAALNKLGRGEKTQGTRLYLLFWRPWTGIFYIAFYVMTVLAVFLSVVRVKP